ncbi:tryptophan halogenase family protein [Streptomyces roseifaciens]
MVKSVTVVGGGTAGWMSASYLKAAFGDRVSVTLVESPGVPTIGVGEATFSTVRHFFDYLGLAETDWMPSCSATYKLAIRFENWRAPGHHFYHPFERLRTVNGFPLTDWWLHDAPTGRFDKDSFLIATLCDANKSPRDLDGLLFESSQEHKGPRKRTTLSDQVTQFPYAYHFDAALLASFLAEYAVGRGVRRIRDDVLGVELDERGWIASLATREHGRLSSDLYIDCTGFRSILLNEALAEPFESYQDTLPNDRAVTLRVPVPPSTDRLQPYTTATAMESGWIWTIPLRDRIGTGYVYASDYCEPEDAERTLRLFVGPTCDGLESSHIGMRVGRSRNSWVKNCVAIGLASGFVEPLESTGIFFIQHGIEQLVKHFPADGWRLDTIASYNRAVAHCMDGVREFLVLHYRGAARADNAYWRDAKTRRIPDPLAERIEQWKAKPPDAQTVYPYYHGFEAYSYVAMLLGLGGIPLRAPAALALMDSTAAHREFGLVMETAGRLLRDLPTQYEYFRRH